ncbi:hypothetical protein [Pseudomonas sp. HY7a-MNA-CIBAN-0227]|uniref:hypothetical protein n=1 Tax=Pseudomonas sp. HY7a-MNA-CIBAN-0227 TaxID=3140474 RepID=UPI0033278A16
MEKVKHHSQYGDNKIKDYAEFLKLAGFIDFQNLLWHKVPVGKGYPSRKERIAIESLYYDESRKDKSHYSTFQFLQTEIETIPFFNSFKEQEMVSFINELQAKNHFKEIGRIERISDLQEKHAARIISCTFYEWVATGKYRKIDSKTREMIFEHKFYDIKDNKIRTDIERKKTIAEIRREYPHY